MQTLHEGAGRAPDLPVSRAIMSVQQGKLTGADEWEGEVDAKRALPVDVSKRVMYHP